MKAFLLLSFVFLAPCFVRGQEDLSEVEQYNRAWSIDRKNAQLYFELGWELALNNNLKEAAVWYEKALAIQPNNGDAHFGMASLLHASNPEKAETHVRAALSGGTQHGALAHNILGNLLNHKGQVDLAIGQFQEAIKLEPKLLDARYNLGLAYRRKGLGAQAESAFRDVLQLDDNHLFSHLQVGRLLMDRGEFEEASLHFKEMLRINPQSPFAYFNLGMANEGRMDQKQALANYRNALDLKPDLHAAARSLAWLLATSGDDGIRNGAQAIAVAEKACAETGYRNPALLDVLAAAQAANGQFQMAAETARKALGLIRNPRQAEVVRARLALYEKGQAFVTK